VLKMAMEDEETVDIFKSAFEELDEGDGFINVLNHRALHTF
jgi:hypothetical protein